MNQAALLDLKKTENELTEVYQKVIQRYSKGSEADLVLVDRLRKAQRAWIKFRDAHIEAIFPSEADRRFSGPSNVCRHRFDRTRQSTDHATKGMVGRC